MKIKTLGLLACGAVLLFAGCGESPSSKLIRRMIRAVESTARGGEYVDSVSVGNVYSGSRKVGRQRTYGGNRCDVKFTLHSGGRSINYVAVFGWYMKDGSDLRLITVDEH